MIVMPQCQMHVPSMNPSGKLCVFHSTSYFIPVHHISSLCCRLPLWYPDEQPLSFSTPFGRDLAAWGFPCLRQCSALRSWNFGSAFEPFGATCAHCKVPWLMAPLVTYITAFGLIWLDSWMTCHKTGVDSSRIFSTGGPDLTSSL